MAATPSRKRKREDGARDDSDAEFLRIRKCAAKGGPRIPEGPVGYFTEDAGKRGKRGSGEDIGRSPVLVPRILPSLSPPSTPRPRESEDADGDLRIHTPIVIRDLFPLNERLRVSYIPGEERFFVERKSLYRPDFIPVKGAVKYMREMFWPHLRRRGGGKRNPSSSASEGIEVERQIEEWCIERGDHPDRNATVGKRPLKSPYFGRGIKAPKARKTKKKQPPPSTGKPKAIFLAGGWADRAYPTNKWAAYFVRWMEENHLLLLGSQVILYDPISFLFTPVDFVLRNTQTGAIVFVELKVGHNLGIDDTQGVFRPPLDDIELTLRKVCYMQLAWSFELAREIYGVEVETALVILNKKFEDGYEKEGKPLSTMARPLPGPFAKIGPRLVAAVRESRASIRE